MAEIVTNNSNTKGRKTCRKFLKVDMTPMVDLAFLLITFFIYTTSMAEPVATTLVIPMDGPPVKTSTKKTLTVILSGKDQVLAYEGYFDEAVRSNAIKKTNYHPQYGIGKVIREKQNTLHIEKDLLMVIIKASNESSYKNFVDALDEMKINAVKRYAVVDMSEEEKDYLNKQ